MNARDEGEGGIIFILFEEKGGLVERERE